MINGMTDEECDAIVGNAADAGFGALETGHGCLPLRAMDLDVSIDGLMAHGTVSQTFQNVFAEPLEATYIFPLPPRAAVIGFRMTVAGAVIEGRIDERGQARDDYDAAIARGAAAAIAEEERPDVFTIRVGNIPAQSLARVELTLVAPLAVDSLEATYRFPLVVAARYCPGTPLDGDPVGDGVCVDTDLVPDASRISPPVLLPGFQDPVRLGIRVSIGPGTRGADTAGIATSIPATDRIDGNRLLVIVEPGRRLDRDFILRWHLPASPRAAGAFITEADTARPVGMGRKQGSHEAPGDGTFSCVILPPVTAPAQGRQPRDVVFVLDRSGSMGAWQIGAARRALARMIDTLSGDDRVAVIAFDETLEHFGETMKLVAATDRQRFEILAWLGNVEARGGTEMAQALEAGLKLLTLPEQERGSDVPKRAAMLVLVTDGQIGDEERVLAQVRNLLGRTALHIVGIDTAINEGLLSRLADVSGGGVELVESEDRLDAVMERIHQRLVPPLLTDIRLEGDGIEIIEGSLSPKRIPNLLPGVPLVLRGRYRTTAGGTVAVHGRERGGGEWRIDLVPAVSQAAGLGALWARGRLRQLEDEQALDGWANAESLEQRLIDLSTGFGVLCRLTAIVAIDPRASQQPLLNGGPRQIVQPVSRVVADMGSGIEYSQFYHETRPSPRGGAFPLLVASAQQWIADSVPPDSGEVSALRCVVEQEMIREAVVLVKPRSGEIADLPMALRHLLFGEVRKVIAMLRSAGVPMSVIRQLAVPLRAAKRDPTDIAAIRTLLDALAVFAELNDAWWQAPSW